MDHFLPFCVSTTPAKNSKIQNFEKMKTIAADIIILLLCTKLQSERQNILSFWAIFLPFFSPNKFLKNEKIIQGSHHFTHVYQKSCSYDVCFLRYGCDRLNFLLFLAIFCSFNPLLTPRIKIWKKYKNTWRYYPFSLCTKNDDHMMYGS